MLLYYDLIWFWFESAELFVNFHWIYFLICFFLFFLSLSLLISFEAKKKSQDLIYCCIKNVQRKNFRNLFLIIILCFSPQKHETIKCWKSTFDCWTKLLLCFLLYFTGNSLLHRKFFSLFLLCIIFFIIKSHSDFVGFM